MSTSNEKLMKLKRPELAEMARNLGFEFNEEDPEITKAILVKEIEARQPSEPESNTEAQATGEESYDIYEIYGNKYLRTYNTLEQAESFVKKFPGYRFDIINPKKGTIMDNEETLAPEAQEEAPVDPTPAPDSEVGEQPAQDPEQTPVV